MENKVINLLTAKDGCLYIFLDEDTHTIRFDTPPNGVTTFPLSTAWLPNIMVYVERAAPDELASRIPKGVLHKIAAIAERANDSVQDIQACIDAAEDKATPEEWDVSNDAFDPVKREGYRRTQKTMSERAWKIITDLIQQTLEEKDDGKHTASTLEDTRKDMIPRLRETLELLRVKAPEEYHKAVADIIQFVRDVLEGTDIGI